MSGPDRIERLLAQDVLTGLDFVYVDETQTTLDVYFLRSPATLTTPLVGDVSADQVRIIPTRDAADTIQVDAVAWVVVDGRDVLRLTVSGPKAFVPYRLTLDDPRMDPYFRSVDFNFQANCPTGLDCEPEDDAPYRDPPVDFPVDYSARDFLSFRRALLDFAAQRYPHWSDRLEADIGIMLVEVMSALGDELAYYQDRVAHEAYLETATQRVSLRHHTRLVDYDPHEGRAASTWLDVTASGSGVIPVGARVASPDGAVVYEVGWGLHDEATGYEVDAARNSFTAHLWDEDDTILPIGATELFVDGDHVAALPLDDGGDPAGRWVLLQTNPLDPSEPARRWPVRLTGVSAVTDPLGDVTQVTRLRWEADHATPFPMDLTVLEVRGNLLPATAGMTQVTRFSVGPSTDETLEPTIERLGPNGATIHRATLPGTDMARLMWLGADVRTAVPEVRLFEVEQVGDAYVPIAGREWDWRRSLLGVASSTEFDRHFTLDDGTWRRVVGYQRVGEEIVHRDYASAEGHSIRFGDGEFGAIPAEGTIFEAVFRLGMAGGGNVARDTLTRWADTFAFVDGVTNPLAATDGLPRETAAQIRRDAPQAYRAETYRAVRPEDYAAAAEKLDWVQRAGATSRWTGSWLTVFTTPDPRDAVALTFAQAAELDAQLDRYRQAGREAVRAAPRYADLDVEVTVCAESFAYPGDVREGVIEALTSEGGFFDEDHFTFGTPLYRSALESAIQNVAGVRAVERVRVRRRGRFDWRDLTEYRFEVAPDEVIRLENDSAYPERGTLRVLVEGGA